MLKVMAFLVKKQGLESDELIDYYETHHVTLILSLAPAPTTYKRNYVVRDGATDGPDDFDIVTELVFRRHEYVWDYSGAACTGPGPSQSILRRESGTPGTAIPLSRGKRWAGGPDSRSVPG